MTEKTWADDKSSKAISAVDSSVEIEIAEVANSERQRAIENMSPEQLLTEQKKARDAKVKTAEQNIKLSIRNIVDTEKQFEKLVLALEKSHSALTLKDFGVFEREFARNWKHIDNAVSGAEISMTREAELEYPLMTPDGMDDLINTIEARAGTFFVRRSDRLLRAITDSTDKDRKKDTKTVTGFYKSVQKLFDIKNMEKLKAKSVGNAEEYIRQYQQAHDDLIIHLNTLNNLANKYGVKPFTPRNFWTGELYQDSEQGRQRVRHDRRQVEAFCRVAFSRDYRKREK